MTARLIPLPTSRERQVVRDEALAAYLLDHYGTCELQGDECQHIGNNALPWAGRGCPHWKPLGVTNWQELREFHERERYGGR